MQVLGYIYGMKNSSIKKNFTSLSVAIGSIALLLAACGDDSSNNAEEKIEVVSSINALDDCTDKLEGDTVFVKSEKADYICKNGKWVNADSSAAQSAKDSSYQQDSSAYIQPPVVAIKNKSITGFSQKGPFVTGTAVKVYELDGKTYAQTGKSFTGKITSDDGKFKVSNVSLASQYALLEANGYFRNEITGEKSKGAITLYAITDLSDRKNVNINLLTHLEYERVLYLVGTGINVPAAKKQAEAEILKAFGISGNFASSEDLDIFSKGEGNAALLAISVMMLGGLGDDSEKSSEAELTERLAKFAADIEEDGTWDDEKTKAAIADWIRDQLAYDRTYCYYESYYEDPHFGNIQEHIEEWELGDVPDFEKYARKFWYENYGLGECNKSNKGKVQSVTNRYSELYNSLQFICEDGYWRIATNLERDLFKFGKEKKGNDGELWVGPATGNTYKYDTEAGKWTTASLRELRFKEHGYDFGGCTVKRAGEVVSVVETRCNRSDNEWYEPYETEQGQSRVCPKGTINYVCKGTSLYMTDCPRTEYDWEPQEWDIPTSINFLSGNKGTDGEIWTSTIVRTDYSYSSEDRDFIYDEGLDKWLAAYNNIYDDYENYSKEVCTSKRRGETKTIPSGYSATETETLICKETGIPDYGQYSEYYSTYNWAWADEREILYGECSQSNDGQFSTDGSYICDDGYWRKSSDEELIRFAREKQWGACNSSNNGQLSEDGTQKCQDGQWKFYAGLIDDFEDKNIVAENISYTSAWFLWAYQDGGAFSNSRDEDGYWDMIKTEGNKSFAAIEGISGIPSENDKYYSGVLIGLNFAENESSGEDLSNCTAIQYDYKGSGHALQIKDYNRYIYYSASVENISSNWKTVTVSTFVQEWWSESSSAFSWEIPVSSMYWVIDERVSQENIGTYLYIDNVKCIP